MEAPPFPHCPCLALPCLALPRCSFYLRTNTIRPEMIQHAGRQGGRQAGGLRSCCVLPRGLESCRYGGAVGVTFSELGPDSSGDRSSMPSEAMSTAVRDDGAAEEAAAAASGRLLAAPSLHSARRSSRRLVGCWCRVAPVQQPR